LGFDGCRGRTRQRGLFAFFQFIDAQADLFRSPAAADMRNCNRFVLQTRLNDNAVLRAAFEALTPGRRKSYIFHISSAKQAKTKEARADKCVPMILSGRGFNELWD
jgi:hypothetical protein